MPGLFRSAGAALPRRCPVGVDAGRRAVVSLARFLSVVVLLAVLLLAAGCSGGSSPKPAHDGQTGAPVLRIPPDADTSLNETLPGADATVNKIFTEQCGNCHSIGKVGTKSYPLDREGTRHNKKWIEVQIRHPDKHNPDTAMPLFPLDRMTDSQLNDLAGYLANLK